MSRVEFYIAYDGPALQGNKEAAAEMDIRNLAPALLALSALLEETNQIINQGRAKVSASIKASFKSGSFGIDLVVAQEWLTSLLSVFNSNGVNGALNLLNAIGLAIGGGVVAKKGLIQVLRWVKGRKITKVYLDSNSGIATIEVGDDKLEVEETIIELMRNQKVRYSLQQLIADPLSKDGIDTFASADSDKMDFDIIGQNELSYFIAPSPEDELLSEKEYTTNLQLLNVAFQEDNKWRVSDGASSYYAEIKDQVFLDKVQRSEIAFSKGDLLEVLIHETQILTDRGFRADRLIMKVLNHRSAVRTLPLPFQVDNDFSS